MANQPALREEEARFLANMPDVLGRSPAVQCLARLARALGLDYGGIDFSIAPDGRLLLFEANATMAIVPPLPDPVWDYRRPSVTQAIDATRQMLFTRAGFAQ